MTRLRLVAVATAVALGVTLALLALTVDLSGPSRPDGPPATSGGPVASDVVVIGGHPLLGKPAPDFALTDLDGRTVRLSDFRGRPVVVNFWASWCVPCKVEFPLFREARAAHADKGLEILGVIHDDSLAEARAFAQAQQAGWPMLDDAEDVAWKSYQAQALPTTFYVDREGIVREVSFGPPPSRVLDEQLAKIL